MRIADRIRLALATRDSASHDIPTRSDLPQQRQPNVGHPPMETVSCTGSSTCNAGHNDVKRPGSIEHAYAVPPLDIA
jgi:hypothetical protein